MSNTSEDAGRDRGGLSEEVRSRLALIGKILFSPGDHVFRKSKPHITGLIKRTDHTHRIAWLGKDSAPIRWEDLVFIPRERLNRALKLARLSLILNLCREQNIPIPKSTEDEQEEILLPVEVEEQQSHSDTRGVEGHIAVSQSWVGCRFRDKDPRRSGRVLIVEEVTPEEEAICKVIVDGVEKKRKSKIKLTRLKHYRKYEQIPTNPSEG